MTNRSSRFFVWLIAYTVFVAAIVGGMVAARSSVLASFDTEQARDQWQDWRHEASRLSEGGGPVSRRPPKSAEPPALVLLRDHFMTCMIIGLTLSSILFGTLMLMVFGVAAGEKFQPMVDDSPPPRS